MHRADHDNIVEIALDWHRAGRGVALATVIETWGSAPRPVGSQLVVASTGEMMGSVSGGCVEGAVVEEAMAALADGASRVLSFGVSDAEAFAIGLACGGKIRVLVEPVGPAIDAEDLARISTARAARKPVAYTVNLESWARRVETPESAHSERFRTDKSGLEGDTFILIHNPPLRMAIVGAVHIAQPLVAMARICGYDPVLVDPRSAFGSSARFPGEVIRDDWPDEALTAIGLDARTCVVTLTHDSKLDDPAIATALRSDIFYLGCLGSRRTHEKRLERLRAAGFDETELARIHAPVGLDIGAQSPAEIAVSVMAEITSVLRRGA